jgi:hypothetical protein
MPSPTRAWGNRRRQRQEEGYEAILVSMARAIVDENTSPERRAKAQESLQGACAKIGAYHSLSASRLYWGSIRKAEELRKGERGN